MPPLSTGSCYKPPTLNGHNLGGGFLPRRQRTDQLKETRGDACDVDLRIQCPADSVPCSDRRGVILDESPSIRLDQLLKNGGRNCVAAYSAVPCDIETHEVALQIKQRSTTFLGFQIGIMGDHLLETITTITL